jgi:polyisoprenoid-binding protein YceI
MIPRILIIILLAVFQQLNAQKFISKNGHIWFYSHTPLEDIEAHNRQVASILDASTGEIAFNLLVKSFEFKVALMQEHFNENYMESDKYPKSTFKGKITNLDKIDFKKDGTYQAMVSGDLTIHNVTRQVSTQGTVEVKGGSVTARAGFTVSPKDYGIAIPSLVENKIAREIEINVDVTYQTN